LSSSFEGSNFSIGKDLNISSGCFCLLAMSATDVPKVASSSLYTVVTLIYLAYILIAESIDSGFKLLANESAGSPLYIPYISYSPCASFY